MPNPFAIYKYHVLRYVKRSRAYLMSIAEKSSRNMHSASILATVPGSARCCHFHGFHLAKLRKAAFITGLLPATLADYLKSQFCRPEMPISLSHGRYERNFWHGKHVAMASEGIKASNASALAASHGAG